MAIQDFLIQMIIWFRITSLQVIHHVVDLSNAVPTIPMDPIFLVPSRHQQKPIVPGELAEMFIYQSVIYTLYTKYNKYSYSY